MNFGVIFKELWQSWRASLRRPGFVLLAGLTLALGLGLSVAMFALVNTLVLAPLPYPQARQLVVIGPADGAGHFSELPARWYPMLRDVPAVQSTGYSVSWGHAVNVTTTGTPVMVNALAVSRRYLDTLGVRMALGRNFSATETAPNGPRVVILTHSFWQSRYAGRRDILGRPLAIDGAPATIVGVLPAKFRMPEPFALMVPEALQTAQRFNSNLVVIARLRTGYSLAGASAQLDARLHNWLAAHGKSLARHPHVSATSLASNMVAGYASIFGVIMACNLAVLLLAAVNVTNLMLQRALRHGHSQAIRNALGASLLRVALPMLGEGLMIALLGVAMALGIAQPMLLWTNAEVMRPQWFAFVPGVYLTPGVFMLGVAAGVLVILAASLLALWRARSHQAVRELVGGGRSGQTVGASRLSRVLVVLQATLGMTLLMVALLFVTRSQQEFANGDLGIRVDHVISATIAPPLSLYPNAQTINTMTREVLAHMLAIPGVRFVGALNVSPVGGYMSLRLQSDAPAAEYINYQFLLGSPLRALGATLVQGRWFNANDHAGATAVAIVNEAFVQRHMHGNPLGQQVRFDLHKYGLPDDAVTVIGVVSNIETFGPGYPAPSAVYVPMAQMPPALLPKLINRLHFEAAVSGSPITYAAAMRQAVHAVAPQLAVQHARSLSERMRNFFAPQRMMAEIMSVLAAVALLLASLGLYAVVSVATQARRREWGVRGALGAAPLRLLAQVLRSGLGLIAIGATVGLMLGWAASRVVWHLLTTTLAHVDAQSAVVAALALALLIGAGTLACLAPALRAARTPPVAALSED